MDERRSQIQEDLRGLIAGEARCDDIACQLYASDASLYQIRPLGVVRPRTTADVVACVEYASRRDISLHARGAGTGLAGESLGSGLVLDFSRFMRRMIWASGDSVRVQPGLVLGVLNKQLAARGQMFGPDPAMSQVTTIGSVMAIDAAGSHSLKYGSASHYVTSMQVVLADGTVLEVSQEPLPSAQRRLTAPLPIPETSAAGIASPGHSRHRQSDSLASSWADPAAAVLGSSHAGHREFSVPSASLPAAGQLASDLLRESAAPDPGGRRLELVSQIAELIWQNQDLIHKHRTQYPLDRSGYRLWGLMEDDHLNLPRLLCGSEGTLAIVTEVTLKTIARPAATAVALIFFHRLESAARAAWATRSFEPSACDLLDRRLMSLAQETDQRYQSVIPSQAEAALLVELEGQSPSEADDRLAGLLDSLAHGNFGFGGATVAANDAQRALFWQLARRVVPTLSRLKGLTRAVPFVEDMAVPPQRLAEFLLVVQNILKTHQVTASLFSHAGHGQLHLRPFLDVSQASDVRAMRAVADDLYRALWDHGGTVSGEHGDGLSRTSWLPLQYGELYRIFRETKRIFDPYNLFNPGKIIGDDPFLMVRNLREGVPQEGPAWRVSSERVTPEVVPLQLSWTPGEVAQAARNCNGCGACRTELPNQRMCPIFRFSPSEEASPRAKANLMRAVMTGTLPARAITGDDFKQVVDLCVNCKMCRLECPASVDIPKLMLEARAEYVAANGLRTTDWLLSRLEMISRVGSRFSRLANWIISTPRTRWLLERILGIAQTRKLPRFTSRPFLRRATRRRLTRPTGRSGPKVLYFIDTYANYHDPQLGEAFVALLEHNGIAVYVPPWQWYSGMSLLTVGAVDRARQVARHNVAHLAECVRQGYRIVATEPSAVVCLTQDYPNILEDPEAEVVAGAAQEACDYLWQLHQRGGLRTDFPHPIRRTLAYHQPCHSRALQVGSPAENLLRLIPGLSLQVEDHGCSGMAGTFGLKRENFRSSLRAGWELIQALRQEELEGGTTECSACKLQMEQGAEKPTIHPIKLLALACGLLPGADPIFDQKSEPLVVS